MNSELSENIQQPVEIDYDISAAAQNSGGKGSQSLSFRKFCKKNIDIATRYLCKLDNDSSF